MEESYFFQEAALALNIIFVEWLNVVIVFAERG